MTDLSKTSFEEKLEALIYEAMEGMTKEEIIASLHALGREITLGAFDNEDEVDYDEVTNEDEEEDEEGKIKKAYEP